MRNPLLTVALLGFAAILAAPAASAGLLSDLLGGEGSHRTVACTGNDTWDVALCLGDPVPASGLQLCIGDAFGEQVCPFEPAPADARDTGRDWVCAGNDQTREAICIDGPLPA